jgi:hypothetical protein
MITKTFKTVKDSPKDRNFLINQYILSCIDGDSYGVKTETDKEKISFVFDCFLKEYCFKDNLKRYGSYQNTFANWLMGLPSSINIDFENYAIIERLKEFRIINSFTTEKKIDLYLSQWFEQIASKCMQMAIKNGVNVYQTKG